ncbi:MAG: serine/threonine-protein kinase [Hyphomonas sp.]
MSQGDRYCPSCGADNQETRFADMRTIGELETLDDTSTRGGSKNTVPTLEPGTVFSGRYTIESVVGKGGMGIVYRAHDKLAEKAVALKLIRTERLSGPGAVKQLISEGLTARDIRHQNVVAVYDVGEAEGQPFVSMEFLDGQSLRDWHRGKIRQRQDVPLRVAARIVAEILDGLSAAHAAGVIHRDLKPENIMLSAEPSETSAPLKILDFGIACVAGVSMDSGTRGIGTPDYMAPEQKMNADSAGPAADLYSLSKIFYELLMEVLPSGFWQPPSGGRSDVPAGIDTLISRGLSDRPPSRQQTAKEYRTELVNAVNLAGGGSKKPDKPTPLPSIDPKIRKWVGIGSGGLLAIVLLGAIWPNGGGGGDDGNDWGGSGIQSLSGEWNDGNGSILDVDVSHNGRFSGDGMNPYGYTVQISGQFNGTTGDYTITVPQAGMAYVGTARWDQGCHVDFQTRDANNNVIEQGRMHVNHEPGAPCS